MSDTKAIHLPKVPKDVYEYLLDKQAEIKKKMNGGSNQFGIDSTIYKIIRSQPDFNKVKV